LLREEMRKIRPIENVKSRKGRGRHDIYRDLSGNPEGCSFWVPLGPEEQRNDQEYANTRVKQLPISVVKKPKSKGCRKCENAILMMARVPPWPAGASKIMKGCDEFHLVESWIATSLNAPITLAELSKGDFHMQFIEKERTMPELHLAVLEMSEAPHGIVQGISTSVVVAEHLRFVARQLGSKGTASFLILAFDGGKQAVNYCEHTSIPNPHELGRGNAGYHSLRFQFQGDEAVFVIDPRRVVPIYAVQILLETR
jgi:hypothetical protein